MWDLECLEMVVDDLKKTEKDKQLVERLYYIFVKKKNMNTQTITIDFPNEKHTVNR